MPVRALRFIHAANLRLEASLSPPGGVADDLRSLLDDATATAFSHIISAALEHDVDALLITGNTFDAATGSLSAEVTLHQELRRLEAAGLPVCITPGVLDPASAWQEIPGLPDNVTVFLQGNEAGIDLTDKGRTLATVLPMSAQTGVEAPELERIRTAGHAAGPRQLTIGLWIPEVNSARETAIPGFSSLTYLAAGVSPWTSNLPLTEGHVHRQAGPQGLNAAETGWNGCQLVEIDATGGIQSRLIPVAPVRWETCLVDGRNVTQRDELCERMLSKLEQMTGYPGEQLRIITWPVDQGALESAGVISDSDLSELQHALTELTDQPKHGLRYLHRVEPVWDESHFPSAVDRELWQDFLGDMERNTPLELERLARLWEQQTGAVAPPAGWPADQRWPNVNPERIRRLALQNGRRWFRQSAGGAAR